MHVLLWYPIIFAGACAFAGILRAHDRRAESAARRLALQATERFRPVGDETVLLRADQGEFRDAMTRLRDVLERT